MIVSEINIYPVKSLSGISLETSKTEERGLEFDRRMMLVDQTNKFITQRECPEMATIRLKISENGFIASKSKEEMFIPFSPDSGKIASVKIWSSNVTAVFYDGKINDWFSDVLNIKCSLVFMNENAKRIVSPFYAVRKFEDTVSFADGYPYLLIGENSLADLNEKLETPLPMNRFRPNLVVKNSEAFAEDGWKKIKIGNIVFNVVKPCDRCVMTTIDQSNGFKDGKEPLKTLAKYRTKNGKVLFGQYLIAENSDGFLSVGDEVEILKIKN